MTVVDGPAVERVVAFSRLLRERGVASTPLSSIEASRVLWKFLDEVSQRPDDQSP